MKNLHILATVKRWSVLKIHKRVRKTKPNEMKKLFLLFAASMCVLTASAQLEVGGGLVLGSKLGIDDNGDDKMGFGLQGRGSYGINEKMGVSGGLTYFFPSTPDGYDLTMFEVFADFNYHFYQAEPLSVYGLLGINYAVVKWKIDVMGFSTEGDDSEVGINFGVGAKYSLGNLNLYGELKYNTAFENIMFDAGVLIPIGGGGNSSGVSIEEDE